jgi:hypothetical protein
MPASSEIGRANGYLRAQDSTLREFLEHLSEVKTDDPHPKARAYWAGYLTGAIEQRLADVTRLREELSRRQAQED